MVSCFKKHSVVELPGAAFSVLETYISKVLLLNIKLITIKRLLENFHVAFYLLFLTR